MEFTSDVKKPSREVYSVSGNYRVRVWVAFLEWPRPDESAAQFVERLQNVYANDYGQSDFEIELSRHADGSPKFAFVRLRTVGNSC